jgi:hypothetical protein
MFCSTLLYLKLAAGALIKLDRFISITLFCANRDFEIWKKLKKKKKKKKKNSKPISDLAATKFNFFSFFWCIVISSTRHFIHLPFRQAQKALILPQ